MADMLDRSQIVPADVGRRVLVVDDDRDFADALSRFLELEGYDVKCAYSSPDVWDTLDSFKAEVALIDIRLGKHSGIQLTAELRKHYPAIMCIMMTAFTSAETAIEALQEGAYDYLNKPFVPEDMIATLQRCFDRMALVRGRDAAEAKLRKRNRELEEANARLHRIVKSMNVLPACSTLRELCAMLLEEVAHNLAADDGAIYLQEDGALVLKHALGLGHAPAIPLPAEDQGFIGRALRSQSPIFASGEDARKFLMPIARPDLMGGSILLFPVNCDSQTPTGVLCIYKTGDDIATLQEQEFGQILTSFGCEAIRVMQALENLTSSEERLASIIDNSPSAIALKDLKGRYLVVNRRFEQWHNLRTADVVGKSSFEVFPEKLARVYSDGESEVLDSNRVIEQEVEFPFGDGALHSVLVTKFPVRDAKGRPMGVGRIETDVTDRRIAEEQLRQAQKMEAVGQLTGGVAHDFNNLLAVILGNLELLEDELGKDPYQHELIADALDSALSGVELTNRLLAFGRRQTLRPQVMDVRDLVTGTSKLLERTLSETIEVKLDLAKELWLVEVDSNQLEMSLLNLAINARDAIQSGGQLTIETANIRVKKESANRHDTVVPGEYLMVAVRDTGTGMTADILDKTIQPFFTTKEVGHGSGLGLSMVYGFVKQSGGHIEISSEPGSGTTVRLYLPRAKDGIATAAAEASEVTGTSSQGEKILIVEDKPRVRKLAKRMLSGLGYEILEAADGDAALALLDTTEDVDLLFTDIVLPGSLSGFQLAREALVRDPKLKVLYTSGYARNALATEENQAVVAKLVQKPFRKEELARLVRIALHGERV